MPGSAAWLSCECTELFELGLNPLQQDVLGLGKGRVPGDLRHGGL